MKKISTRLVSIILSLILVISSLPLTALSASAADGDASTTNLAASDVAYCGTGVGIDSNKCVRFPEQGYTAIKHCEFTFTGTVSGNQAVGTFSSDALGYTKYLNTSSKAQQPLKTTADTFTVAFNTGINGTASLYSIDSNNNNKKITFSSVTRNGSPVSIISSTEEDFPVLKQHFHFSLGKAEIPLRELTAIREFKI